jgi:hypothetical protein
MKVRQARRDLLCNLQLSLHWRSLVLSEIGTVRYRGLDKPCGEDHGIVLSFKILSLTSTARNWMKITLKYRKLPAIHLERLI